MTQQPETETVAAVDLGSNSFHMVIARDVSPEPRIVDRVRERVRLAGGLTGKRLSDEAQERALACLTRMGQRVRHLPHSRVRAVGTNTLRRAKNARKFLKNAQKALGHPIEVISGQEEARLIYLGVAHSTPDDGERRLVVDIGGGSTECILGQRFDVHEADSLHMGCVSFSRKHFPGGELKKGNMRRAVIAARVELQTLERRFQTLGWETCVGASGTVNAIAEILRVNGWDDGGITRVGMRKLRKALYAAGNIHDLKLPGLKPERAPVLPGGYAILRAIFQSLGVEKVIPSVGALREGLLYDQVGRIHREDARERTTRRFLERYNVDVEQAARVERTAQHLLERVRDSWDLTHPTAALILGWAARLHEIGMVVSYSSYHKHGAYLLQNSYMPGFSNDTQEQLAALVRLHRRKIPAGSEELPDLPPLGVTGLLRLCVLLRLAVLLNRSRNPDPLPSFFLEAEVGRLRLTFAEGWLEESPLTRADLEVEAAILESRGFHLAVE